MTSATTTDSSQPFAKGSISISLYIHGLAAREAAAFLVDQAVVAEEAGFDGVTVSEHHAGVFEYVPQPLLAISWMLGATRRIWGAPCPMQLSIRKPMLVAEELAWLAARFPGRVGAGFGPGTPTTPHDYIIGQIGFDERRKIFNQHLPVVADALRGRAPEPLDKDPAIRLCAEHPVPCLSTVGGPLGARRAAKAGVGMVPSSPETAETVRGYVREYKQAGGNGTIMLNRRAWFGPPDPGRMAAINARQKMRAGAEHYTDAPKPDFISSEDPDAMAKELVDIVIASDANALNIKFTSPDSMPAERLKQIEAFGRNVAPLFKKRMAQALG